MKTVTNPFGDFLDAELHAQVAKLKSVRAAASACQVSQPAASRRLREMERRCGIALYETSVRGTLLTEEGEFWVDRAERLIMDNQIAESEFAETFLAPPSRLRLVVDNVVAEDLLARSLGHWSNSRKDRRCDVEVGNHYFVRQRLSEGEAELGFLELVGDGPKEFHSVPIVRDELVLVASSSHPLAHREVEVTLPELARMPLLQREATSGLLVRLRQFLNNEGVELPPPRIELGSASAVKSAVLHGLGASVMPRLQVIEELQTGDLVQIFVRGLSIPVTVNASCRRTTSLSEAAKSLIASMVACAKVHE